MMTKPLPNMPYEQNLQAYPRTHDEYFRQQNTYTDKVRMYRFDLNDQTHASVEGLTPNCAKQCLNVLSTPLTGEESAFKPFDTWSTLAKVVPNFNLSRYTIVPKSYVGVKQLDMDNFQIDIESQWYEDPTVPKYGPQDTAVFKYAEQYDICHVPQGPSIVVLSRNCMNALRKQQLIHACHREGKLFFPDDRDWWKGPTPYQKPSNWSALVEQQMVTNSPNVMEPVEAAPTTNAAITGATAPTDAAVTVLAVGMIAAPGTAGVEGAATTAATVAPPGGIAPTPRPRPNEMYKSGQPGSGPQIKLEDWSGPQTKRVVSGNSNFDSTSRHATEKDKRVYLNRLLPAPHHGYNLAGWHESTRNELCEHFTCVQWNHMSRWTSMKERWSKGRFDPMCAKDQWTECKMPWMRQSNDMIKTGRLRAYLMHEKPWQYDVRLEDKFMSIQNPEKYWPHMAQSVSIATGPCIGQEAVCAPCVAIPQ